jgi:hypothetical protein
MVDEGGPSGLRSVDRVSYKSAGGVRPSARLPDVIGRGARDNDVGALALEKVGGVDEVRLVREYGLLHTTNHEVSSYFNFKQLQT